MYFLPNSIPYHT